jgi:hypothetical protein
MRAALSLEGNLKCAIEISRFLVTRLSELTTLDSSHTHSYVSAISDAFYVLRVPCLPLDFLESFCIILQHSRPKLLTLWEVDLQVGAC